MRRVLRLAAVQIVLLLIGGTFLGALHSRLVPQFLKIIAVGPHLALVIENGSFCVPDTPLAACHTAIRSEFRVWLYAVAPNTGWSRIAGRSSTWAS